MSTATVDYYGILGVPKGVSGDDLKEAYRKLARKYHPDLNPGDKAAEEKFKSVQEAYDILNDPNKREMYDKSGSVSASSASPVVFGEWVVTEGFQAGDVCDLYRVESSKTHQEAILKIAKIPGNNDLVKFEAESLKLLAKDDYYKQYFPALLGSLSASGRFANVISKAKGDLMPLSEIMKHYPRGLDFRHIVWMMNRGLTALKYMDTIGVVHGAITPEHLLYGPESHDLNLVDFCYSVQAGGNRNIPAIVPNRKDLYPQEVFKKLAPTPVTDLFMLCKVLRICAADVPPRFRPFFEHATADYWRARPTDLEKVQERWKQLAREEYGARTYVKLNIPK